MEEDQGSTFEPYICAKKIDDKRYIAEVLKGVKTEYPSLARTIPRTSLLHRPQVPVVFPLWFIPKYWRKEKGRMTLEDESGRKWPASYLMREYLVKSHGVTGRRQFSICQGWNEFAQAHKIEQGEVLLFEVIGKEKVRVTFPVRAQMERGMQIATLDKSKCVPNELTQSQDVPLQAGPSEPAAANARGKAKKRRFRSLGMPGFGIPAGRPRVAGSSSDGGSGQVASDDALTTGDRKESKRCKVAGLPLCNFECSQGNTLQTAGVQNPSSSSPLQVVDLHGKEEQTSQSDKGRVIFNSRIENGSVRHQPCTTHNPNARDGAESLMTAIEGLWTRHPSFARVMTPTDFLKTNKGMALPAQFFHKYVKGNAGEVALEDDAGKRWDAFWKFESSGRNPHLQRGWLDFAMAKGLLAGDVLLFELLNGAKLSSSSFKFQVQVFKVVVFRMQSGAPWAQLESYIESRGGQNFQVENGDLSIEQRAGGREGVAMECVSAETPFAEVGRVSAETPSAEVGQTSYLRNSEERCERAARWESLEYVGLEIMRNGGSRDEISKNLLSEGTETAFQQEVSQEGATCMEAGMEKTFVEVDANLANTEMAVVQRQTSLKEVVTEKFDFGDGEEMANCRQSEEMLKRCVPVRTEATLGKGGFQRQAASDVKIAKVSDVGAGQNMVENGLSGEVTEPIVEDIIMNTEKEDFQRLASLKEAETKEAASGGAEEATNIGFAQMRAQSAGGEQCTISEREVGFEDLNVKMARTGRQEESVERGLVQCETFSKGTGVADGESGKHISGNGMVGTEIAMESEPTKEESGDGVRPGIRSQRMQPSAIPFELVKLSRATQRKKYVFVGEKDEDLTMAVVNNEVSIDRLYVPLIDSGIYHHKELVYILQMLKAKRGFWPSCAKRVPKYQTLLKYMDLPVPFMKQFLPGSYGPLSVEDERGRKWRMAWESYGSKNQNVRLRSGWHAFAKANEVVTGTVLLIEVVSSTHLRITTLNAEDGAMKIADKQCLEEARHRKMGELEEWSGEDDEEAMAKKGKCDEMAYPSDLQISPCRSQGGCTQLSMTGFRFCIRHILEDAFSPYYRCQYGGGGNSEAKQKQPQRYNCSMPVWVNNSNPRYCLLHRPEAATLGTANHLRGLLQGGEFSKAVAAATLAHEIIPLSWHPPLITSYMPPPDEEPTNKTGNHRDSDQDHPFTEVRNRRLSRLKRGFGSSPKDPEPAMCVPKTEGFILNRGGGKHAQPLTSKRLSLLGNVGHCEEVTEYEGLNADEFSKSMKRSISKVTALQVVGKCGSRREVTGLKRAQQCGDSGKSARSSLFQTGVSKDYPSDAGLEQLPFPPAESKISTFPAQTAMCSDVTYVGIRRTDSGKFVAEIPCSESGWKIQLGSFPTAMAAAKVYDCAAREQWGPQAKTNFAHANSDTCQAGVES